MKALRVGLSNLTSTFAVSAALCLGSTSMFVSPAVAAQSGKAAARKSLSQSLTGVAKANFEAAKLLASDGDYANALIKFDGAYEASRDPRLLWNVAFCHKNLRHYAKVVLILKRYVEEGGEALSANDKKEALELIALIEPFTTRALFQVSENGANIYVDDEPVGVSPLATTVVLDIGERRLRVVKEGYRSFDKMLVIGGSNELKVDVALEKEVHEGRLIVNAPIGANILLDGKPVATTKLEQAIASGGHQIQVTAPAMRAYQTEVAIHDRETRSLDVVLEALAPAEKPKLHVAVGCAEPEPKAPEEGLVVYMDGPDVLPATSVKRKWSEEQKKNVVEWVEYTVSPGQHQLHVSITDCRGIDVNVNIDAQRGAQVSGALESDRFFLFRGPLGSPGWHREALGLFMPAGKARYRMPEQYDSNPGDVFGVTFEFGLVAHWFAAFAQMSYGKGSFQRETHSTHYALPESATTTWNQWLLRAGPRIPFHSVALGFGVEIGLQEISLEQVRTGVRTGMGGLYSELDVQPFCDFGLFALVKFDKPFGDESSIGALSSGVYYQPNARCRKERATVTGVHATNP